MSLDARAVQYELRASFAGRSPKNRGRVIAWAKMKRISEEVRWSIVLTTLLDGLSAEKIRKRLKRIHIRVSLRSVRRVLACYKEHNEVTTPHRHRPRLRVPAIDPIIDQKILDIFIEEPESTAMEAYCQLCEEHGLTSHYSTFCKAMHRLGFSHKLLRGYSQKRDAGAALAFKAQVVGNYSAEQLIFLDETSKDSRALNRSFGWALRGITPIHSLGKVGRGSRRSALCTFDVKGFVDWYIIKGTYNRDRFLKAVKETVVRCLTASLPRCLAASLPRCLAASLPRSD